MRTVYLLRHAKSSWDDSQLLDHDRPLAPRGIRAAKVVAQHLRTAAIAPDVLLCSSARRTRETLDLLSDALPQTCEVRIEDDLYGAGADELLQRLRALPDRAQRAMLVGHNPGLQRLAVALATAGEGLDLLRRKMPTAALATLDAAIDDWPDLAPGCAVLTGYVRPKDLDDAS